MRLKRAATQGRWAPGLAATLAFAVLMAVAAFWALQLASPRPPIAPAGPAVSSAPGAGLGAARGLFGRSGGPAKPILDAAPGNVKVLGVIAGGERQAAVIAVDGKRAHAYGISESVDSGMKIARIERDHVVLERGGESIRVSAPPWTDLSILTSGVGKPRGGTPAGALQAPGGTGPAPAPGRAPGPGSRPGGPAAAAGAGKAVPAGGVGAAAIRRP